MFNYIGAIALTSQILLRMKPVYIIISNIWNNLPEGCETGSITWSIPAVAEIQKGCRNILKMTQSKNFAVTYEQLRSKGENKSDTREPVCVTSDGYVWKQASAKLLFSWKLRDVLTVLWMWLIIWTKPEPAWKGIQEIKYRINPVNCLLGPGKLVLLYYACRCNTLQFTFTKLQTVLKQLPLFWDATFERQVPDF
jgi:hypothetical protein